MATIGNLAVTLQDMARRLDANGKVDAIVEMLNQTNEILPDMLWLEGNLVTGHKTTIRTGLPEVAWRLLNYGVPNSKSKTAQITDTCGMLEAYAEVDKVLADLNGNTAAFRLSEDRAYLESMNQNQADTLFYGDTSKNPERFLGLAPRFSTLDKKKADSARNVIDAGGTGNRLTSIWLVAWGDLTIHGIFPKGSKAGFQHQDLGEVTLFDANNNKYQGYRTHYKWDCGLTVRDWRYVVRIANIDLDTLTKDASNGADLINLMTRAVEEKLEGRTLGRPVWYAGREVRSFLRQQITNKAIYQITQDQVEGRPVTFFDGIPVRRVDAIRENEARVIA